MANKVQRPKPFVVYDEAVDDDSIVYSEDETTVYMDQLEAELRDESAWLESHWKQAVAEGKDNYAVHLQNAIEALKSYGGKG